MRGPERGRGLSQALAGLAAGLAMLAAACAPSGDPRGEAAGAGTPPASVSGASDTATGSPGATGSLGLSGNGEGAPAGPVFEEAAQALGVDFVHANGMAGEYWFPEVLGPGVAVFDYDGDGDMDLYFVQNTVFAHPDDPAQPDAPPPDRLYRNDLRETGRLAFSDVTEAAGLVKAGAYGQGVAAGDVDNDGDTDLFLPNYGQSRLLLNQGDGRFADATEGSGLVDDRWSSSATFLDYDRDGLLDLFVANYVDYTRATHKPCYSTRGERDYCGPLAHKPYVDRLYRNLGGGRFEDVSEATGIAAHAGAGLGVIAADFNRDGWVDIYVANDGMDNVLWINRGGERFENEALVSGTAFNAEGAAEASMGVIAEDLDEDQDWDIFLTHLNGEHNTLYVNDGQGLFEDQSVASGLAAPSYAFTGFGVGSLDYDGDGRVDLFVSNGAVRTEALQAGTVLPSEDDPLAHFRQTKQLFWNAGGMRFEDATPAGGPALALPEIGRGLAVGDLDEDGAPDLVLANNHGPARVLMNRLGPPPAWLGLRLVDARGRDAYGAELVATLDDGRVLLRRVHADGSYFSSRDPRLQIGLGEAAAVRSLELQWPSGAREAIDWTGRPLNQYHTIQEGLGVIEAEAAGSDALGATGAAESEATRTGEP